MTEKSSRPGSRSSGGGTGDSGPDTAPYLLADLMRELTERGTLPEPEQPYDPTASRHCWCGGLVVDGQCMNADPNEVGP